MSDLKRFDIERMLDHWYKESKDIILVYRQLIYQYRIEESGQAYFVGDFLSQVSKLKDKMAAIEYKFRELLDTLNNG